MRYILTIILLNISNIFFSQTINIPDTNFKELLLEPFNNGANDLDGYPMKIDKNGDGEIQTNEAELVGYLSIPGYKIETLEGIQFFKNLYFLNCHANKLISINLTELSKLEYLCCSFNQIENLNLSNNKKLNFLDCNNNKLTNLDLSNIDSLVELKCNSNNLNTIKFNNSKSLEEIEISYNNIELLDVSMMENLIKISCAGNKIKELNFKNCINISRID